MNIKEVLKKHEMWLNGEDGGEKAALHSANLRYADLRYADLRYADLRYADLRSANLRYANLHSADLRYADLRYADLRSADLRYADLSSADLFGEKINKIPLMIYNLKYDLLFTEKHIKIGCEVHKVEAWKEFNDKRILEMDGKSALLWWKENKEFVMSCYKKHIG